MAATQLNSGTSYPINAQTVLATYTSEIATGITFVNHMATL